MVKNMQGRWRAPVHYENSVSIAGWGALTSEFWRRGSESNRRRRLCRPLHDHSATPPGVRPASAGSSAIKRKAGVSRSRLCLGSGAGNESRTRDLNLGKVALYQLSYSRAGQPLIIVEFAEP